MTLPACVCSKYNTYWTVTIYWPFVSVKGGKKCCTPEVTYRKNDHNEIANTLSDIADFLKDRNSRHLLIFFKKGVSSWLQISQIQAKAHFSSLWLKYRRYKMKDLAVTPWLTQQLSGLNCAFIQRKNTEEHCCVSVKQLN